MAVSDIRRLLFLPAKRYRQRAPFPGQTRTFAANAPGIFWSPPEGWQDTENGSAGGNILARECWVGGAQVDFTFTGTQVTCSLAVFSASNPTMQVSIDGGAFTSVTMPVSANVYTSVTLATGLTDAQHTITLKHNGGTIRYIYINFNSAFTVTGSAPAINPSPAHFGPQYLILGDIAANGAIEGPWLVDAYATNAGLNFGSGSGSTGGYEYPTILESYWNDVLIRFKGNPTEIWVWCYRWGSQMKLWQDGAAVGSVVTTANNPDWGWAQLASGLDGTVHEYGIIGCQKISGAGRLSIQAVMLVGGTLSTGLSWPRRGAIIWQGDSIMEAATGVSDSTLGVAFQTCANKNRQAYNMSIGSTTFMAGTSAGLVGSGDGLEPRFTQAIQQFTMGSADYAVITSGFNDLKGDQGAVPSAANWQTAWQNHLTRVRKSCPNATIYALGVLPTNNGAVSPNRAAYNAATLAAVTAINDPKISYVNMDTLWGTGGTGPGIGSPPTAGQITTNTADGIHPNATGYSAWVSYISNLFTTWAQSSSIVINQVVNVYPQEEAA